MPLDLHRVLHAPWKSFLHLTKLCGLVCFDGAEQHPTSYLPPSPDRHDDKTKRFGPDDDVVSTSVSQDMPHCLSPSPAAHNTTTKKPIHVDDECTIPAPMSRPPVGQDTQDHFPLTGSQLDELIEEFINSIDKDALCHLASRHNNQQPCHIVGQDNGSFNVCFFVRFDADDVTWVVRLPIEPVVQNSWEKIQSEVATMRYIELHTTIPIPHIHAYGESAGLIKNSSTTHAFLISDYLSGNSLNLEALMNATEEQRKRFYEDLIDILAQLRKLEFPKAGSLMPNPDNTAEPIIGGLLSMAANELQRCVAEPESLETFTTEKDFINYQYRMVSKTCLLPTERLTRKHAEMELFALDNLLALIREIINSQTPHRPFVLTHSDLRCGNIIITEDFHIRGIIDWEFTGTIPQQFFTPPPWITGCDLNAVFGIQSDAIFSEFHGILQTKSQTSSDCAQLLKDWSYQQELIFPIAQILQHPSSLLRVYYKFIFRQFFEGHRDQVVPEHFRCHDKNGTLALEVERKMEESKRYTQYLEDHGLLVVDDREQEIQEWLAKARALLRNS